MKDSPQPAEMSSRVRQMFDFVAPSYDSANRILSFGQSQRLRRSAINALRLPERGLLLDLCTGSADLALAAREQYPDIDIAGVDFSAEMLNVANKKCNGRNIHLIQADALALPLRDQASDVVTIGWGLRNIVDIRAALLEMARVLKPDGQLVVLEFSRPKSRFVRVMSAILFRVVALIAGITSGGSPSPYGIYLPESIKRFPAADELSAIIEACGFRVTDIRRHILGNICTHVCIRSG